MADVDWRDRPRLTWQQPADEVAWQRQVRDRYVDEPAPPIELNLGESRVRRVTQKEAERVILKYEWLGTMSKTSLHYGLFFGPFCAGVTCLAISGAGTAGTNVGKFWQLDSREVVTLARGACVHWAPPGTNSRLVSWTSKLLRKDLPVARIVLAYADEDAGEIGTIYQACNWSYVGPSSPVAQVTSPEGRVMDSRLYSDRAKRFGIHRQKVREQMLAEGWVEQSSRPKHRYVYVVRGKQDRSLWDLVAARRLPYPKRNRTQT